MRKQYFVFLIIILLFAGFGFAGKVKSFTGLNKPDGIAVDDQLVVITEGTTVYLYSAKDFSLVKKFGKKGEGPQEFTPIYNTPLRVQLLPGYILVGSMGKISFFKRNGEYIKERKHIVGMGGGQLYPMGDGFAAMGFAQEDKKMFLTIELHDSDIKKIKEIYRMPLPLRGQKYKILEKAIFMQATGDKIYVAGEADFIIHVFDKTGKKLYSINPEYNKIKFTDLHKTEIWEYYKTNPTTRQYYEQMKNFLEFPDYFQAVRSFVAAGQKLYVQTYKRKDGKTEFFIFDDNGKFLKTAWLPINVHVAVNEAQLFAIHGGKLYQLIENEDEEEWELHITKIE